MNKHEAMWVDLHKQLEKLMEKNMKRLPAGYCHEFQALMNEIEEKHRGHIELRGSDEGLRTYIAVENNGGGEREN